MLHSVLTNHARPSFSVGNIVYFSRVNGGRDGPGTITKLCDHSAKIKIKTRGHLLLSILYHVHSLSFRSASDREEKRIGFEILIQCWSFLETRLSPILQYLLQRTLKQSEVSSSSSLLCVIHYNGQENIPILGNWNK